MKVKFPIELYVVVDGADGEEYFLASAVSSDLAGFNDTRPAARYTRAEKVTLVNSTEVVDG